MSQGHGFCSLCLAAGVDGKVQMEVRAPVSFVLFPLSSRMPSFTLTTICTSRNWTWVSMVCPGKTATVRTFLQGKLHRQTKACSNSPASTVWHWVHASVLRSLSCSACHELRKHGAWFATKEFAGVQGTDGKSKFATRMWKRTLDSVSTESDASLAPEARIVASDASASQLIMSPGRLTLRSNFKAPVEDLQICRVA